MRNGKAIQYGKGSVGIIVGRTDAGILIVAGETGETYVNPAACRAISRETLYARIRYLRDESRAYSGDVRNSAYAAIGAILRAVARADRTAIRTAIHTAFFGR